MWVGGGGPNFVVVWWCSAAWKALLTTSGSNQRVSSRVAGPAHQCWLEVLFPFNMVHAIADSLGFKPRMVDVEPDWSDSSPVMLLVPHIVSVILEDVKL